jgi:hypothetical protein
MNFFVAYEILSFSLLATIVCSLVVATVLCFYNETGDIQGDPKKTGTFEKSKHVKTLLGRQHAVHRSTDS